MTPQENFITERRYLKSVTPATVSWYKQSFKKFNGAMGSRAEAVERIGLLKEQGLSPSSINCHLRVINAFWKWNGQDIRIPKLKEEQKILGTFSPEQIHRIVNGKAVGRNQTRVKVIAITACDSGLRFQELLSLMRVDVDFDNLTLRVHGKGNKQRLVPMSVELRKILYRHLASHQFPRVFATTSGLQPSKRNVHRDLHAWCQKLGIADVRTSFHTFRHTFAVNYLRAGGNLYYLQRILGHSSISTTEKYLKSLGIEDLRKVHDGLSLLSR